MPKEIEDALSASILQTSHMPPVTPLAGRLHRRFGTTAEPDEHPLSVEPKAWAGRFDSDRVRTDHYPTAVRRLLAPGDGTRQYQEAEVLHGVSFDCVQGGMTAIVGPSGSGKSTVARLIASFWEAESGGVRIGGVDVRNIPLSQIMELVSYVSQDNFLFHLSIRENIRIGKPEATDAEIEAAAKKASCHDFIAALPEGYDTLAGDAGNHLSGGERQRIAIARAILKNSPIVVLDEATAFTDPENEAVIQASIAGLVAGKTLIVIAHRLSTITKADKILVVDKGNVVAEGTHEELLETSNLYKELWRAHMQGKDTAEEVV